MRGGRYAEAEKHLRAALAADPQNAAAQRKLTEVEEKLRADRPAATQAQAKQAQRQQRE
jgi:hypothetical protein